MFKKVKYLKNSGMLVIIFLFGAVSYGNIGVFADTITLKSGEKLEGNITEKTDKYVKIDISGVPITYFLDEVESIKQKSNEEKALSAYKVGMGFINDGRYKDAEDSFSGAISLDKNNAVYPLGLEIIKDLQKGAIDESACKELLKGCLYVVAKRFEDALPFFEKIAKKYPDYPKVYLIMGSSYFLLGKNDESVAYLEKVIAIDPLDPGAYSVLGVVYSSQGLMNEAKKSFGKAIELFRQKGDEVNIKRIEDYMRNAKLQK